MTRRDPASPPLTRKRRCAVYTRKSTDEGLEKINSSYVSRMLRLTLLAPDMVEAILDGRQQDGVTLAGLLEGVPVGWGEQKLAFC